MTPAERAALGWLDECALLSHGQERHARTIKAMLARPCMPEEATPEIRGLMVDAHRRISLTLHGAGMNAAYRALYAHLSKPPTHTMQVWLVHYARQNPAGRWEPRVTDYESEDAANAAADYLRQSPERHAHVRVSGPHAQEIPT